MTQTPRFISSGPSSCFDAHDDLLPSVASGEFDRLVDLMNTRGHASSLARETPADLRLLEWSIVMDWIDALQAERQLELEGPQLELEGPHSNPNDPPDCWVEYRGNRIGVEVVELVKDEILAAVARARKDGRRITSHHSPLFQSAIWSKEQFLAKLTSLMEKKDQKYQRNCHEIDVLLVATGEPYLSASDVSDWLTDLEGCTLRAIKSVYLMLDYQPGYPTGHHPIFFVSGKKLENL